MMRAIIRGCNGVVQDLTNKHTLSLIAGSTASHTRVCAGVKESAGTLVFLFMAADKEAGRRGHQHRRGCQGRQVAQALVPACQNILL